MSLTRLAFRPQQGFSARPGWEVFLALLTKTRRRQLTRKAIPLLAFIGRTLILTVGATLRVRVIGGDPGPRLALEGRRAVYAFFHGRQFLLVHRHRGQGIVLMSSLNFMGEVQARVLTRMGFCVFRGSSTRGGARGLVEMIRRMREGYHAALAVDGPRGPLHEVKPGTVFLAKKTGSVIVPLTFSARPAFVHRRAWDRYMLPLPFARAYLAYGEPWSPDDDLSDEALARDAGELRRRLLDLGEQADRAAGR
jgi:lysophospholipid acyltransferase (LPLAT)-like uncharacterized protein